VKDEKGEMRGSKNLGRGGADLPEGRKEQNEAWRSRVKEGFKKRRFKNLGLAKK